MTKVRFGSEPDRLTVRSVEEQRDALDQAVLAARDGNAFGMLGALHLGQIHDGLFRRLKEMWAALPAADVDVAIGAAEDSLLEAVRSGNLVRSPGGYLWRVSDRACQKLAERRPVTAFDPESPDYRADLEGRAYGLLHRDYDEDDVAIRANVLAELRRLVPHVGSGQIQSVARLLLDAIEADRFDLGPDEVADVIGVNRATAKTLLWRARQRLARELRHRGIPVVAALGEYEDEHEGDDE